MLLGVLVAAAFHPSSSAGAAPSLNASRIASDEQALAASAAASFAAGTAALRALGNDQASAAANLLQRASGADRAATIAQLSSQDVGAIVTAVAAALEAGAATMTHATAALLLTKLKGGGGGWGSPDTWSSAALNSLGALGGALDPVDILGLGRDAFLGGIASGALRDVGRRVGGWSAQQRPAWRARAVAEFKGGGDSGGGLLFDAGMVRDMGALFGAFTATDLKGSTELAAEEVLGQVTAGAIRVMGGRTASEAWGAKELSLLSVDAKRAFAGAELVLVVGEDGAVGNEERSARLTAILQCGGNKQVGGGLEGVWGGRGGERRGVSFYVSIVIDIEL